MSPDFLIHSVLPVRNTVAFPGFQVALNVGRKKSLSALRHAQEHQNTLIVVAQKLTSQGDPPPSDLYSIGTLAKIESITGSESQGFHIGLKGVSRFRITEYVSTDELLLAHGEVLEDRLDGDSMTISVLVRSIKELAAEILEMVPGETEATEELIARLDDPIHLAHLCSVTLELPIEKKQELLENVSLRSRMESLLELMRTQREALVLQHEIRKRMSERMGREQRHALLREQIKTIREELGEDDPAIDSQLRGRIVGAGMPEEVEKVALGELRKLQQLSSSAAENHTIRTYLDWLCLVPWRKSELKAIDLQAAEAVLNTEHFGLDPVKRRILEHLAVMKLKGNSRGQVLCLYGPPGVGKTSLGQSVARALGRRFIRASLGGVRDESDIRGHRRTYVGAMPGRIIQGIKRAGEKNPVYMLDEIDKLCVSFQGDPAAALLEVLDPAQNKDFFDHYLDVSYDLSEVFFIATANSLDSIPGPLLDRMEVIEINGYTTLEKLEIARRHLLPRQLEENGLTSDQLRLEEGPLSYLVTHYTREAGVRELNRKLGALCRAVAGRIVRNESTQIEITPAWIEAALGAERYVPESSKTSATPGVVTGLAWTPQGGDILFIEASSFAGNGQLILTGQLGDIMKESARIGMSLVRSALKDGPSQIPFDKMDIHIHVPAGAIPKDGPSAGTAILTAIASLLIRKSVDPRIAMTGEITLRGAVLPVGGIKEKLIAAHRAGIRTILLPSRNEKDLREIPVEVRSDLQIRLVETIDEILDLALGQRLSAFSFGAGLKVGTRRNGASATQ